VDSQQKLEWVASEKSKRQHSASMCPTGSFEVVINPQRIAERGIRPKYSESLPAKGQRNMQVHHPYYPHHIMRLRSKDFIPRPNVVRRTKWRRSYVCNRSLDDTSHHDNAVRCRATSLFPFQPLEVILEPKPHPSSENESCANVCQISEFRRVEALLRHSFFSGSSFHDL